MDTTDRFEMLLRQNYLIPSNNQQQQQQLSNFDYMSTGISEQDYGMDPLLPSSSSPFLSNNSYNRNNNNKNNNSCNSSRQFCQRLGTPVANYNNMNMNSSNNNNNNYYYNYYGGRNIIEQQQQQQQCPIYYNQHQQQQQQQQMQHYQSNFYAPSYYNQQRIKIEPERVTPTSTALPPFQSSYSKKPYCNRKFTLPSPNTNRNHNYISKIENSSYDNKSEEILVPVSHIVPQSLNQYSIHSNSSSMPSTSTVPCFSSCIPTVNSSTVPPMMCNTNHHNNNNNNYYSTTAYTTNYNTTNNNIASNFNMNATNDSTLASENIFDSLLQDNDFSELFNGWYNAMKHILWKMLTPGVLYEGEINGPDRVDNQMIQKLKSCLKTPKINDRKQQQQRNSGKTKVPMREKGDLLSHDLNNNNNKFHYSQVYGKTSTKAKQEISPSLIENNNNNNKVWANKCPVCKLTLLGGRQRFEAHMKNCHHLLCKCGIVFTSKLLFTKHVQKVEEEAKKNPTISVQDHRIIPEEKIKPIFECDMCDEIFRSRNTALQHRENHFSSPPESPTSSTTTNNIADDDTSPSSYSSSSSTSPSSSSASSSCGKGNSKQKLVVSQAFAPSIVNTYSLATISPPDETKKRKLESSINSHLITPIKKMKTVEMKMPKLKKIPVIPKAEKMEVGEEDVVNRLEVEALFTNEKSSDYRTCFHHDDSLDI